MLPGNFSKEPSLFKKSLVSFIYNFTDCAKGCRWKSKNADILHITYTYTGAQPEMFQGRGDFVKLGDSDKRVVKNSRKNGTAGKNFEVFYLRCS